MAKRAAHMLASPAAYSAALCGLLLLLDALKHVRDFATKARSVLFKGHIPGTHTHADTTTSTISAQQQSRQRGRVVTPF